MLLVGYVLVLLTGLMGVLVVAGVAPPLPVSGLLVAVLAANALSFGWRIAMRFAFTTREYGVAEGVRAVLRVPLANVIAIIAGRRAVFAYARTLLGGAAAWDKTDHDTHPAAAGVLGPARP